MLLSTRDDFSRCTEIVEKELLKKSIVVEKAILRSITEDVMNISYAKGGDDSSQIIRSFAKTYVEHGLYKKYIN